MQNAATSAHGSAPSNYGQYGNAPQSNNPYSAGSSNRPIVKDDSEQNVIPIAALNPYANKWTIKARVTTKAPIKQHGSLFSVDLMDRDGTEIRGTFFMDVCLKFFGILEEGQVRSSKPINTYLPHINVHL